MQFKYNDGAPQDFIVRDDVVSWHEMREKRKIDYVSVDQVLSEEIISFVYVIRMNIIALNDTEKTNLESFYSNAFVSLDNEDEVDVGDTFQTYTGNLFVRRPPRILNFTRSNIDKDIEFFNLNNFEIVADIATPATKV